MTKTLRSLLLALLALGLISATTFTSVARAETSETPGGTTSADTWVVPANLSEAQIRKALVNALVGRNWIVKSDQPGQLVGYQSNPKREATVTFTYSASAIEVAWHAALFNKKTGAYTRADRNHARHSWYKFHKTDGMRELQSAAYL
jgi:nitrite reductase/ring-hydroxylating ferredoxin subunit